MNEFVVVTVLTSAGSKTPAWHWWATGQGMLLVVLELEDGVVGAIIGGVSGAWLSVALGSPLPSDADASFVAIGEVAGIHWVRGNVKSLVTNTSDGNGN